jgi:NAD(P) transhydrogenase subunit beta
VTANQVALWYLVASVCFILALKGLSHPSTARRGNALGILGMAIAVVVTLALVIRRPATSRGSSAASRSAARSGR